MTQGVQVSVISSNLAAVFMESFLYGIFFILSIISIYLFVNRRRVSSNMGSRGLDYRIFLKSPMFLAAICLLMTITAHWILTITRLFKAFVFFEDGPVAFYSDLSQPTGIITTGLLVASICIGDAVIIYRLYVIWGHDLRVVVFPVCSLTGLTICGIGLSYQLSQYVPGEDYFAINMGYWVICNCVFAFCTNTYSTVMITFRVWNTNKKARRYGGGTSSLTPVLIILVESAAINTAWGFFYFATYISESYLSTMTSDALCTILGITFMLINVRLELELGWAQTALQHSGRGEQVSSISQLQSRTDSERAHTAYGVQSVVVSITPVTDNDWHQHSRDDCLSNGKLDV